MTTRPVECALSVFAVFLICLAGCGDGAGDAPVANPAVPAGPCVVRGIIRFTGTPPQVDSAERVCAPGRPPIVISDEWAVLNADKTLKNVIVYIKNGPNISGPPPGDALLTQRNCRYEPHVLALQTGQTLLVTSHDPTLHNVHVEADANPSQNFSELQGGAHSLKFDRPDVVRFKCDVHAWMTAYAMVFDHPCFAVTKEDGKFEIGRLPAGTYTLVAWQERYGQLSQTITVSADKPAEVSFEYHP